MYLEEPCFVGLIHQYNGKKLKGANKQSVMQIHAKEQREDPLT
jgi:hypothetical protein